MILVVALGQLTKFWAFANFGGSFSITPSFGFFAVKHVKSWLIYPQWSFPLIGCSLLIFVLIQSRHLHIAKISLIFFAAGTIGNSVDWLVLGYVRDFIRISSLPIFNLADVYLSLSLLIAAGSLIIKERHAPDSH